MKISVERPNPYFENCQKLTEEQQEKYGVDDDTDCDDCPFMEKCSRGEKITKLVREELLYSKALDEWGIQAQEGMLIEELGEVIEQCGKVLHKWNKRNRDIIDPRKFADFTEELVDLQIMLGQMQIALGDQFHEIKEEKLRQLHERITEG